MKGWFNAGKEIEALEDASRGAVHAQGNVARAMADSCPIGGNSFAPDTRVLMADGSTKPIADVRLGDEVLATDPETGQTRAEPVAATIIGEGRKQLVDVTVDGQTVTATAGHPFWVDNRHDWVDAGALRAGDQVQRPDGTLAQITAVRAWTALARVNNLGITDLHTYHVLAGNTPVLVHNCGTSAGSVGALVDSLDDDVLFHYTSEAGHAGISESGTIAAGASGKVHVTQEIYSAAETHNSLFAGAPGYASRGSHVIAFRRPAGMALEAGSQPNELIHRGSVRLDQVKVLYSGANPFG